MITTNLWDESECTNQGQGYFFKGFVNDSDSVPYTEDEIMMLTRSFCKLLRNFGKTSRNQTLSEVRAEIEWIITCK